ncbi:metallophosphoesterase [Pleionea sediminis]|uniref:metallophosphoesterase n=1 Tax=Pleionea sediminis TaxID=2569479 RepID=UPI0011852973|nr:metallophosphoesterase [Pleionea sediminis]
MFKITVLLTLIFFISLVVISRFSGVGIRVSDGSYLGYSASTDEWLIFEYQNIPVMHDGPYVFVESSKLLALRVESFKQTINKVTRSPVDGDLLVTVDNKSKTQFTVPLRQSDPRSQLNYSTTEKVLAISDIEGNFDAAAKLLIANGVIDSSLRWSFGKGHLVLIGDMVDRGTNVLPTLWLLYKLEAEAKNAGGHLHYVLGNHERYLLDGRTKSVAKKYFGTYRATGMTQRQLWSENTLLGRWLRTKPALLKINDILYVHGGISPEVLTQRPTLEFIDNLAKESFVTSGTNIKNIDDHILHGSKGLLFYRGLAKDMSHYNLGKKASEKHVEKILEVYGAQKIAIGHTLTKHIGFDFNDKVVRVDVDHASGESEALLIEGRDISRVNTKGQKLPLIQIESAEIL